VGVRVEALRHGHRGVEVLAAEPARATSES
jgi:hypothetical protein